MNTVFEMITSQDEQGGFVQIAAPNHAMLLERPEPTEETGPSVVQMTGTVTWGKDDRVSRRYGGIQLTEASANVNYGEASPDVSTAPLSHFVGKRVSVSALVTASRASYHCGDLLLDIKPSQTPVGTTVELGTGIVMALADLYGSETLIFCRDERLGFRDFWMDPVVLYSLHDHDVILTVKEV